MSDYTMATGDSASSRGTVFVFPGQGWQWTRALTDMLDLVPAFADEMRRCDAALGEFADWSLIEAVRTPPTSAIRDRVDVTQPMLFAAMVSLAAQWRALAVYPDAVLGHAQGEVAAAYVAGALSLRDAAKVIVTGSQAMATLAERGGMVSIEWPVERVVDLIEPWATSIAVAAQNGPSWTVVTGDSAAVDELMSHCEKYGLPAARMSGACAAHSAQVEALREVLRPTLSGLQPRRAGVAFISGVTGAALDTSILEGDYWIANLRQPVLFEQAVRWCYEHGYRTFLEATPFPSLGVGIQQALDEFGGSAPAELRWWTSALTAPPPN
ncbi:acyltransferase domain-containing protein [Mycolicibacterium agri]|nr:acyltransferase domain-containing protein [Mycolicibacterium agri]GFG54166.1 hypothetical protein MAGR_56070 [Mycolicibacterium agri]